MIEPTGSFKTKGSVDSAVSFCLLDTKDFRGSDDTIAKLSILKMPQGLVCGSDHLTMDRFVGLETGWLQVDDSSPNGYQENKTPLVGEFDIDGADVGNCVGASAEQSNIIETFIDRSGSVHSSPICGLFLAVTK